MDALNATWLTFLPTNTTSRKWRATPLRHDATLTKSRSDVSRPTDAFRNILCQVAQPFVSPSFISLRTCLMVADALTKRRTDVSRPTDAFRNICLGGANMYLQHRRCQVARPVSLHRFQATIASQLLSRINKTQGFSSPRKFSQVSPSPVSKWGDSLSYKGFAFPFQANLRLSCCRALSRL